MPIKRRVDVRKEPSGRYTVCTVQSIDDSVIDRQPGFTSRKDAVCFAKERRAALREERKS